MFLPPSQKPQLLTTPWPPCSTLEDPPCPLPLPAAYPLEFSLSFLHRCEDQGLVEAAPGTAHADTSCRNPLGTPETPGEGPGVGHMGWGYLGKYLHSSHLKKKKKKTGERWILLSQDEVKKKSSLKRNWSVPKPAYLRTCSYTRTHTHSPFLRYRYILYV